MTLRSIAALKGISIGSEVDGSITNARYQEVAGNEFSHIAGFSYFMVQNPQMNTYDWTHSDILHQFAIEHNQYLYAPGLVFWWSDPDWVWNLDNNTKRNVLRAYIDAYLKRYQNRVKWVTVVNENLGHVTADVPWTTINNDPLEYVRVAFHTAHQAAPAADLLYNDNGIEFGGTKSTRVFNALKRLIQEGVPIDGIGFQCHFNTGMYGTIDKKVKQFVQTIRNFRSIGLTPHVTELDVGIPKSIGPTTTMLRRQATIYEKIVRAAKNEGVRVLTVWGFTDARSWLDTISSPYSFATIMDKQYVRKPAFRGLARGLRS